MPLSWNEIKSRAVAFSKEWELETNEDAEAKSFWDDFFDVFGISRRRVATFEQLVKKLNDKQGYIDLLWKGMILIEHKTRGKDLTKAFNQAKEYFPGLNEKELPRYILVSDFARFRLYDLDKNIQHEFTIHEFVNNVSLFSEIAGYKKRTYKEQDPVNIEAAELMGKLHDKLKAIGYTGHHLEVYLVRLVFCLLDWGKISPAIFGSLFQSVMDEKARRNLGAHYTSEKNILKLIKPLFLDDLWKEFNQANNDKRKLQKLHDKISKLRFLDPACGCGNFLIIAYRELRLVEMEIVKALLKNQQVTDISHYFLLDVDRFYGIEYEEFPAQIAQVAMWLIDHQMNMKASELFGEYYVRLPLRKSATIKNGNALRIDWQSLIH